MSKVVCVGQFNNSWIFPFSVANYCCTSGGRSISQNALGKSRENTFHSSTCSFLPLLLKSCNSHRKKSFLQQISMQRTVGNVTVKSLISVSWLTKYQKKRNQSVNFSHRYLKSNQTNQRCQLLGRFYPPPLCFNGSLLIRLQLMPINFLPFWIVVLKSNNY